MSSAQKRLLKPLIFATASSIRREIVESHGINCEFVKSDVDEELIKRLNMISNYVKQYNAKAIFGTGLDLELHHDQLF